MKCNKKFPLLTIKLCIIAQNDSNVRIDGKRVAISKVLQVAKKITKYDFLRFSSNNQELLQFSQYTNTNGTPASTKFCKNIGESISFKKKKNKS